MVFGLKVAIIIIIIPNIFILYFCIIKTSVMPCNSIISEKCEYYKQYILERVPILILINFRFFSMMVFGLKVANKVIDL
jgi:hypothetical protein